MDNFKDVLRVIRSKDLLFFLFVDKNLEHSIDFKYCLNDKDNNCVLTGSINFYKQYMGKLGEEIYNRSNLVEVTRGEKIIYTNVDNMKKLLVKVKKINDR